MLKNRASRRATKKWTCSDFAFVSALFFSLSVPVQAEYKTFILSSTNANYPALTNFVIGANTTIEFLGGSVSGGAPFGGSGSVIDVQVVLPDTPGTTNFTKINRQFGGLDWSLAVDVRSDGLPTTVVGPVLVELSMPNGPVAVDATAFYTVKISGQAGTVTPSTAVVIPSDAKGPVNIVMESSTNLVDWVAALPGTYGSSNKERYFRVRAVVQ